MERIEAIEDGGQVLVTYDGRVYTFFPEDRDELRAGDIVVCDWPTDYGLMGRDHCYKDSPIKYGDLLQVERVEIELWRENDWHSEARIHIVGHPDAHSRRRFRKVTAAEALNFTHDTHCEVVEDQPKLLKE